MKKLIVLFLALVICAVPMGMAVRAADAQITMESVTAAPGDQVALELSIEGNTGVAYLKLKVAYDSDVLTLESAENAGLLEGTYTTSKEIGTNPYVLQWMGAANSVGDGVIATLTFTLSENALPGDYEISVSLEECYDEEYEDVVFAVAPGMISVAGADCAHGQTELRDMREANCLEDGYTGDTWCLDCGEMIASGTVIPAPGYHVGGEATCTETAVCEACGIYYGSVDTQNHKGETEIRDAVEPDCHNDGYTGDTYCMDCGKIITVGSAIEATGEHVGGEATCIEKAVCDVCGFRYGSYNTQDHRGVVEIRDAVEPDCGNDGYTGDRYCSDCGTLTDLGSVIEATGDHNDEDGDYICDVCGTQLEIPKPDAPQIQSCFSRVQTAVKVTWTLVEGANGYQLWRSATPDDDASWRVVKTITDGTKNYYTNQDLTEGVTYYYKIRAYIQNGNTRVYSDFSQVKFMPATVLWNSPYSNSSFRIRLRWAQVDGAHGYQIWRCDKGGTYRIVKTIGDKGNTLTQDMGDVTAYGNTGLTPGARYTYKMRAFYIADDGSKSYGAYSDEITVAVQPVAPGLTVTSSRTGRATIVWDALSGADGYQVWMSETADTGFTIIKSILSGDTTSYTKNGLESGKTYYFKVRGYVEVDGKKSFGEYSDTIAVTIK